MPRVSEATKAKQRKWRCPKPIGGCGWKGARVDAGWQERCPKCFRLMKEVGK